MSASSSATTSLRRSNGARLRRMRGGAGVAALAIACAPKVATQDGKTEAKSVVVYTSLYQEVVEVVEPVLEEAAGVDVTFVQGGSGKIAKRLDDEIAAGAVGGD